MHLVKVQWLRARSETEQVPSVKQIPPREKDLHPIDGRYPIAPVKPAPRGGGGSMSFLAELRAELVRAKERVELLERVIAFYSEDDLNGAQGAQGRRQKQAPRDTAAKQTRTRAGAAEAAQARSAQPVETEKGTPPSTPRSPAKHHPKPDEVPRGQKWCGTCETTKPRAEFGKNTAHKDGLQTACKPCMAEHQRRGRERKAKAEGRQLRRSPNRKAEEPDPVRAIAAKGKRCPRCGVVRDADEFVLETGRILVTCTRCLDVVRNHVEGLGELHKAEHAARLARIQRRVVQRPNRRKGHVDGPYVRCLVARAPQSAADTKLTVHATCGAVVLAGDERDHLDDVHGMAGGDVAQLFEPIAAGGGMTKKRTSGSARGSEGRP